MGQEHFQVPPRLAGRRLDAASMDCFAGLSLRAARRAITHGWITLNGRIASSSHKVAIGDRIGMITPPADNGLPLSILAAKVEGYFFFHKPAGLHTVSLAGAPGNSLGEEIPLLLNKHSGAGMPMLLQRLDYGTSGLICAAEDEWWARKFRVNENAGLCVKYYFTILHGILDKPVCMKKSLDTSRRKTARVLDQEAEELKWTLFRPIAMVSDKIARLLSLTPQTGLTLALCAIKKGQRHQIRAHAAAMGHPLYGDGQYGGEGSQFFLDHFCMKMPGCKITFVRENSWVARLRDAGLVEEAELAAFDG